ncbi:transmembrane protein, putative (macronuclear) [Tetrahymena thermophila SB210]|uniref:Transmembrane protein, putative n=1 Tax=Tetrahymena thermophila (strain SB210) TaxID=312017 RepID=W7XBQ4_TETTS|nr:transmembrane protein, putative [Tetrahymena thermophila SB210]EWS73833.1 transmembrane protein, putative [Tetrahymena thermophila SB210]|eukprot:XP_012653580.1 transmembrane protein, putative [Tetrahymena thermophila SB210]
MSRLTFVDNFIYPFQVAQLIQYQYPQRINNPLYHQTQNIIVILLNFLQLIVSQKNCLSKYLKDILSLLLQNLRKINYIQHHQCHILLSQSLNLNSYFIILKFPSLHQLLQFQNQKTQHHFLHYIKYLLSDYFSHFQKNGLRTQNKLYEVVSLHFLLVLKFDLYYYLCKFIAHLSCFFSLLVF